jgi:hypothetical protein
MAGRQSDSTFRVEDHPDYPAIFQQAREEAWGELLPKYEEHVVSGNVAAMERIETRVAERARQRAAVATQALRRAPTDREFDRLVPPLTVQQDASPDGPIPRLVPPLANQSEPVPAGQGLQPQSDAEREQFRRDAESFGDFAVNGALLAAGGPITRGVMGVGQMIARNPGTALAGLTAAGVVAAPAQTQTDARGTAESAQRTLDRFTGERQQLLKRQQELINLNKQFENISTTDTARIRQLQELLAVEGLYGLRPDGTRVTPDGKWGEGTRLAIAEYRRRNLDERNQIATQLGALAPNINNAQKALQAAQRAAAVEAGNERLREIENEASVPQKALRNYGPAMGYALGLLGLGPLIRWGVTRYEGAGAARAADKLMAETRRDVPGRVGRVNEFWTRGQSPMYGPRQAPFTRDAASPAGYAANPRAPEASALFQPNRVRENLENAVIAGLGVGDMALAQFWLIPKAEEEERQARAALRDDPNNEAAIRRLQAALDMKATYQMLGNMGVPSVVGYAGASHFMPRSHVRPNVGAAEAERLRLDRRLLADTPAPAAATAARPRPAPGDKPPEGSIWNESAQRWMGPAEPGRAGRPFLSGDYAPPRNRRRSE